MASSPACGGQVAEVFRMIDQVLLDILICPVCKSRVRQQDESICCTGCGRVYPIRDGIPVMLASEAVLPDAGKETSPGDQPGC